MKWLYFWNDAIFVIIGGSNADISGVLRNKEHRKDDKENWKIARSLFNDFFKEDCHPWDTLLRRD